ncbi:MAG: response regulator [Syntrophobacterales bacterium]
MDQAFRILIADRNRNVRNFLRRELLREGYEVILAGEGRELLRLVNGGHSPDILILDPDIPTELTKAELIKLLHFHHPAFPIVIHTLLGDEYDYAEMPGVAVCLEKGEDTALLKKVVADVIRKCYPPRHTSQI